MFNDWDVVYCNRKDLVSVDYLIDDAPHNGERLGSRMVLYAQPYNADVRGYAARVNGFEELKAWVEANCVPRDLCDGFCMEVTLDADGLVASMDVIAKTWGEHTELNQYIPHDLEPRVRQLMQEIRRSIDGGDEDIRDAFRKTACRRHLVCVHGITNQDIKVSIYRADEQGSLAFFRDDEQGFLVFEGVLISAVEGNDSLAVERFEYKAGA